MLKNLLVLLFVLSGASLASCNKNGCSRKNKIEITYNVEDSTSSPPAIEYQYYDNYRIIVTTCSKNDAYIEFQNLGNNSFSVPGELDGTDFTIPTQDVNENVKNFQGTGRIIGDSIFFDFGYINWYGEPISSFGQGSIH